MNPWNKFMHMSHACIYKQRCTEINFRSATNFVHYNKHNRRANGSIQRKESRNTSLKLFVVSLLLALRSISMVSTHQSVHFYVKYWLGSIHVSSIKITKLLKSSLLSYFKVRKKLQRKWNPKSSLKFYMRIRKILYLISKIVMKERSERLQVFNWV